jgi:type I restriction enzyme S subunit
MIPKSWRKGKVLDFFELQRGFDLTNKIAKEGHVPVISSSGIAYYHDEAKVKGPGVITGRKGKVGNVIFFEGDFWPHDTSLWVKDFKGNHPKYIYHFLQGMKLERLDEASSVPTLNRNNVHKVSCQFPPIDEQIKITVIIDTWDQFIKKTDQLIASKEKQYLWLLSNLCSNDKHHLGYIRDFALEVSIRNNGMASDLVLSVTNNRGFILPSDQFERRVASSDLSNYKVVTCGQYAYNPSRINVGSIARLDG